MKHFGLSEDEIMRDWSLHANDALLDERLMPFEIITLGRKGNNAAFVPGIISQFLAQKPRLLLN